MITTPDTTAGKSFLNRSGVASLGIGEAIAAWPVDWRQALTPFDRRRRRTHWGSRESQLLPRFLENLLGFGEFVEQLIGQLTQCVNFFSR
jgi:hypothetical protein